MTDQRLASVSRNLREQGYVDNDPDATLAAIRLIVLADALDAQQTDAPANAARDEPQPRAVAGGGEQYPSPAGVG